MSGIDNQNEFLKERGQLLTDEEILELDGSMFEVNDEIMRKAGDIVRKLGETNSKIQRLRDAYCQCKKNFEKTEAALADEREKCKKEKETVQKIGNNYLSLKQSYEDLQKENSELKKKMEAVNLQQEKMPALMRLYHAYQSVMEKKSMLPQEFFEYMQSVVPLDDFDGFLPGALRESYPVSFYQTVQSFITVCNLHGEVSGETLKDTLCTLDTLLSAVFDLGSAYWKAQKLSRIDIEAGDPYDSDLCRYIDEKGEEYGNIVKVWLHGFRDEKKNETYRSYVEGE